MGIFEQNTILAQPHSGLTDQCQVMAQEPTANLTTEDGPPIVGVPSRAGTQLLPVQSTQLKLYPPEIEFYAIEPEILHVVRIVATNLDSVPHRISRGDAPKDQRISTDR